MEAHNSSPIESEEPEVVHIPKKRGGFFVLLKNVLVFIALIGVIVASFWVSFNLGRSLLVPVKKEPARKIEVAVPEPPPAIAALQEFEYIDLDEEKGDAPVLELVDEPETKPAPGPVRRTAPAAGKTVTSAAPGTKYYKVQAGVFSTQSGARSMARQLQAKGFETYIRKVSNGWRVQVGAFIGKKWALNLQQTLKAKGFDSTLIYE